MEYHEKVAAIVAEAKKLVAKAQEIDVAFMDYTAAREEVFAQARAVRYPIRELDAILPKVRVKIEIPPAPKAADLGAM